MAQMVKNLPAMQEMWVQSLGQEDPLEKEMATTSVFLPAESHGQRSLVGYHPWGCRVRHNWVMNMFIFIYLWLCWVLVVRCEIFVAAHELVLLKVSIH